VISKEVTYPAPTSRIQPLRPRSTDPSASSGPVVLRSPIFLCDTGSRTVEQCTCPVCWTFSKLCSHPSRIDRPRWRHVSHREEAHVPIALPYLSDMPDCHHLQRSSSVAMYCDPCSFPVQRCNQRVAVPKHFSKSSHVLQKLLQYLLPDALVSRLLVACPRLLD
jgi:hypothetical protein